MENKRVHPLFIPVLKELFLWVSTISCMWASANALAQSLFTPSQTISIIGLFLIIGAATLTHGHRLPPISVRFLVIWAFLLVIYTFTHITLQLALVSEVLTAVALIYLYARTLKGITSMQRTLWVGILFLLLPFFERIHQLINFPFRVFATRIVSLLFQLFGFAHTTSATIISIENKAAYVDIPCSGLRSIHTGLIVFIALCLIYRPSRLRIVFAGIASLCVLLAVNIWRIFNIVWIDTLWKKPDLAATLHVWFGLIGFAIACGFMMRVLRTTTSNASSTHIDDVSIQNAHSHAWVFYATAWFACIYCLHTFLYTPTPIIYQMLPQTYLHVAVPSAVQIPFTNGENTFFASGYVRSSGKYQTDTSQILIVKSPYARTHHDPQTCLQSLGETIIAEDMFSPYADMYIRRLTLRSGDFVYYWFTDGSRVVFDYGERVWEGLRGSPHDWSLYLVRQTSPDLDLLNRLYAQSRGDR